MNDKAKNRTIFILSFIIIVNTGLYTYRTFKNDRRANTVTNSEIVEEIRRIDNVIEVFSQQFRSGIDEIQTGINGLTGIIKSTGERTNSIAAGIERLEKGTGKAIGYSESIINGFTRIEGIIGEMGRAIEDQGLDGTGIGADIREQVEILRKELGLL